MSTNNVDLQFNLDTRPAESSLDKLSSQVPKSLEKIIKRFDKLGRNIKKIAQTTQTFENRIHRTQRAMVHFLEEGMKGLQKSIKETDSELKKLSTNSFYKKIPNELKKSQGLIVSYRKALLALQKESMKAISGQNVNFDTKNIEKGINKLNVLKSTLEKTVGISLKGIDASNFNKELKKSIESIVKGIEKNNTGQVEDALTKFFQKNFKNAEKALDKASDSHSVKIRQSIKNIKGDLDLLNKAIAEINRKNAELIRLGAQGMNIGFLDKKYSKGSVPNVAEAKKELSDLKKILNDKIKLQKDINHQTDLLHKSIASISSTGSFSKKGMSEETLRKAEAERQKFLAEQKKRIIHENRELEELKIKKYQEAERRVAQYTSKTYKSPKRLDDIAVLDDAKAKQALGRLDDHIRKMEERETRLHRKATEIFQQIEKTGKYDKQLAREFNQNTRDRFEAAKQRKMQQQREIEQEKRNLEESKRNIEESRRQEEERKRLNALRIKANEQIRKTGSFDQSGMTKDLIRAMNIRKDNYLEAEKKRIFSDAEVVYQVRKERADRLAGRLRQLTLNMPEIPMMPSLDKTNKKSINALNDSFDKYEDKLISKTDSLRNRIARAYKEIRETGTYDKRLLGAAKGSDYEKKLDEYKKQKSLDAAIENERVLNLKKEDEANRKQAEIIREQNRLNALRSTAQDQIRKTWSFDRAGMTKELISELNQFRTDYIGQQQRAIRSDVKTVYDARLLATSKAVANLKQFMLTTPSPPLLPSTDQMTRASRQEMIAAFDGYEKLLDEKTKRLSEKQRIALEQIKTRADGSYDKKLMSGMEGTDAQRIVEDAKKTRQAEISNQREMERLRNQEFADTEAHLNRQWKIQQDQQRRDEQLDKERQKQEKKNQAEQERLFNAEIKAEDARQKQLWSIGQRKLQQQLLINQAEQKIRRDWTFSRKGLDEASIQQLLAFQKREVAAQKQAILDNTDILIHARRNSIQQQHDYLSRYISGIKPIPVTPHISQVTQKTEQEIKNQFDVLQKLLDDKEIELHRKWNASRDKAFAQISQTGKYNAGLASGMDKQSKQYKAMETARLKKMKEIRGQLYKKFNQEAAKFPELQFTDKERDKFVQSEAERIVNSNAYRQAVDNKMTGVLFQEIVDKQMGTALEKVNKQRDLQAGYTRKSYKDASQEIIRYAQKLERLGTAEAQKSAKFWRDKAELVRAGSHDELQAYKAAGTKIKTEYLQRLQEQEDYYKKLLEQEKQGSGLLTAEQRKHRKRASMATKRLEQIGQERERVKSKEGLDYLTGDVPAGRGGRGGASGQDGFNAGRVDRYRDSLSKLRYEMDRTHRAIGMLRTALYTLGAGFGLKSLRDYYDAWVQFSNRIRLVTDGVTELKNVQEELLQVAERTAIPLYQAGELYEKLSRAGDRFDISSGVKVQLTELIGQTISISGSTAAGAKGAITQFIQGLGTELRGQELASVREQIPRLATAIAEGLDVPIAKLKELGAEGKITPDVILTALIDMVPVIQSEFGNVQFSITQSFERISNAMSKFIGKMFESFNKDGGLSAVFRDVSDYINNLADSTFFPDVMKKLESLVSLLKEIGKIFIAIFSVKLITSFGAAIVGMFTALRAQMGAVRREATLRDKATTFFRGGFQGAQGEFYTTAQRREAERDSREKGAGGPALMAARGGGALMMGSLFIGITAVIAVFSALSEKSELVKSGLKFLGDAISNFLDLLATSIDKFLDWAPWNKSQREKIEEARAKKLEEQTLNQETLRLKREIESGTSDNDALISGALGKVAASEFKITGIKADLNLSEVVITDKKKAFEVMLKGISDKIEEDFSAEGSDQAEKNRRFAQVNVLREYVDSFEAAQRGIIDMDKKIRGEEFKQENARAIAETSKERAESAKARYAAGEINERELRVAEMGFENARNALERIDSSKEKVEEYKKKRAEFVVQAENSQNYINQAAAKIMPEAEEQSASVINLGQNSWFGSIGTQSGIPTMPAEKTILSPEYKDFVNYFRDGSFLTSMEAGLQTVASQSEALQDEQINLARTKALDAEKKRYEGKDSIIYKQLEAIEKETELFNQETNFILDDMKTKQQMTIQSFAVALPQIEKSYNQAKAEAEALADSKSEKAKRDMLSYINSEKEIAKKHEATLVANKAYADAINEIEREKAVSLENARQEQEKALEILKLEVSIQRDVLSLTKKSLELTKGGEGAYSIQDLAGKPQEVAQEITQQRQNQQQLAMNLSRYLVENGKKTREEGEKLMKTLTEVSWEDALNEVNKEINSFADGNKEVAENLKKILNNAYNQEFTAKSGLIVQINEQIVALKNQNQQLDDELQSYKKTMEDFADTMINLEVRGGADPVSQITNKLVNDSFQLASERKRLMLEQQRIRNEISQREASGQDTTIANLSLSRNEAQVTSLDKRDSSIVSRSMLDMENTLNSMIAKNSLAKETSLLRQNVIFSNQLKMSLELLDSETSLSRLQQQRTKGAELNAIQVGKIIELEKEMAEAGFDQRVVSTTLENATNLQMQLQANLVSETEALALAEARNSSQEELNKISDLYLQSRTQIALASGLELDNALKLIEAEKKLAEEKRKSLRDTQLVNSGLFGQSFDYMDDATRDKAQQVLKNPAYKDFFKTADQQLTKNITASSRNLSVDERLKKLNQNDPEAIALGNAKALVNQYYQEQRAIAKGISEANSELFDSIQEIQSKAQGMSAFLENSERKASVLIPYLEAQRDSQLEEMRLQLENKIRTEAIAQGLIEGSDGYNALVEKLTNEDTKQNAQRRKQAKASVLKGLRDEYKFLHGDGLDIFGMSEGSLNALAPLMDGLREFSDIARDVEKTRGVNLETKTMDAMRKQAEQLQIAKDALSRGDLEAAQAAQNLAMEYEGLIEKLHHLSEQYLIYNQRQNDALKLTLAIEREQAFDSMTKTEREIAAQIELAQLKKEGILTENQLAEVASRQRRESINAELNDQRELLYLRQQSELAELSTRFDVGSTQYKDNKNRLEARFHQEERILEIQHQQNLASVDAAEKLRKLNQEQKKGIQSLEDGLSKLMGTYFSFIGSIFTGIFEAIFGKKKDRKKEEAEIAQERMKRLEKQKKDLAEEVSLRISTDNISTMSDLNSSTRELTEVNRALVQAITRNDIRASRASEHRNGVDLRAGRSYGVGPNSREADYQGRVLAGQEKLDGIVLKSSIAQIRKSRLAVDDPRSITGSTITGHELFPAAEMQAELDVRNAILKKAYSKRRVDSPTVQNQFGFYAQQSGELGLSVSQIKSSFSGDEKKDPTVHAIETQTEALSEKLISIEEVLVARENLMDQRLINMATPEQKALMRGDMVPTSELFKAKSPDHLADALSMDAAVERGRQDAILAARNKRKYEIEIGQKRSAERMKSNGYFGNHFESPEGIDSIILKRGRENSASIVKTGYFGELTRDYNFDSNYLSSPSLKNAESISNYNKTTTGSDSDTLLKALGFTKAINNYASPLITPPPARYSGLAQKAAISGGMGVSVQPRTSSHLFGKTPSTIDLIYANAAFGDLESENHFMPTFGFNKNTGSSTGHRGYIDAHLEEKKNKEDYFISRVLPPLVQHGPFNMGPDPYREIKGEAGVGDFPEKPDAEIEGIVEAWIRNVVMNALSKQKAFGPDDGITAEFYPDLRDKINQQIQSTGDFYPKISKGEQDYDLFLKAYKNTSPFPSDLLVPAERISEQMIDVYHQNMTFNREFARILHDYVTPVLNDPISTKDDLEFASSLLSVRLGELGKIEEKSIDMTNLITEFFADLRQYHQEIKAENSGKPLVYELATEKHSRGGFLDGPSHAQGGVNLGVIAGARHEAEGGEYIIRKDSVSKIGKGALDYMNQTGSLPSRNYALGGLIPTVQHNTGWGIVFDLLNSNVLKKFINFGAKSASEASREDLIYKYFTSGFKGGPDNTYFYKASDEEIAKLVNAFGINPTFTFDEAGKATKISEKTRKEISEKISQSMNEAASKTPPKFDEKEGKHDLDKFANQKELMDELGVTDLGAWHFQKLLYKDNRLPQHPDQIVNILEYFAGRKNYKEYMDKALSYIKIKPMGGPAEAPTNQEMFASLTGAKSLKEELILDGSRGNSIVDLSEKNSNRLDIPSYNGYLNWITTQHIKKGGGEKSIYSQGALQKDVSVKSKSNTAANIGTEIAGKTTIARMEGTPVSYSGFQELYEKAIKYSNDPEWVEVGMNPKIGSGFYLRENWNGHPAGTWVGSWPESIQVGPYVLVKNPKPLTPEEMLDPANNNHSFNLKSFQGQLTKVDKKGGIGADKILGKITDPEKKVYADSLIKEILTRDGNTRVLYSFAPLGAIGVGSMGTDSDLGGNKAHVDSLMKELSSRNTGNLSEDTYSKEDLAIALLTPLLGADSARAVGSEILASVAASPVELSNFMTNSVLPLFVGDWEGGKNPTHIPRGGIEDTRAILKDLGVSTGRDLSTYESVLALIGEIAATWKVPSKFLFWQKGGYLKGPSHEKGGIDLGVVNGVRHEAEGGEYIIRKDSVDRLGVGTLDYVNQTGKLPKNRKFGDGQNGLSNFKEADQESMFRLPPQKEKEKVVGFWEEFFNSAQDVFFSIFGSNDLDPSGGMTPERIAQMEIIQKQKDLLAEQSFAFETAADVASNLDNLQKYRVAQGKIPPPQIQGFSIDLSSRMKNNEWWKKALKRDQAIVDGWGEEDPSPVFEKKDNTNFKSYTSINKLNYDYVASTERWLEEQQKIKENNISSGMVPKPKFKEVEVDIYAANNIIKKFSNILDGASDNVENFIDSLKRKDEFTDKDLKAVTAQISSLEELKEKANLDKQSSTDMVERTNFAEKEAKYSSQIQALKEEKKNIRDSLGITDSLQTFINSVDNQNVVSDLYKIQEDNDFSSSDELSKGLYKKYEKDLQDLFRLKGAYERKGDEGSLEKASEAQNKMDAITEKMNALSMETDIENSNIFSQFWKNTVNDFETTSKEEFFEEISNRTKKWWASTSKSIISFFRENEGKGEISLKGFAQNAKNWAGNQLIATGKSFGRGGKFVGDAIGGALTGDVSKIGDAVSEFIMGNKRVQKTMEKFGKVITRILDPLAQAFLPVIEALGEMFTDLAKAIEPLMPIIIEFAGALANLIKLISSISVPVIGGISSVVGGIFDGIMSFGSAVGNVVKSIPVIGNVFGGLFGSGGKRKSMDDLRFESIRDSLNEYLEEKENNKPLNQWDQIEKQFEELYDQVGDINDPSIRKEAMSLIKNITATEKLTEATKSLEETMKETTERISEAALTLGISYESLDNLLKTGTTSTTYQDSSSVTTTGRSVGRAAATEGGLNSPGYGGENERAQYLLDAMQNRGSHLFRNDADVLGGFNFMRIAYAGGTNYDNFSDMVTQGLQQYKGGFSADRLHRYGMNTWSPPSRSSGDSGGSSTPSRPKMTAPNVGPASTAISNAGGTTSNAGKGANQSVTSDSDSSHSYNFIPTVLAPTTFNTGASGADPMINMTPQEQAVFQESADKGLFESVYDSINSALDSGVSAALSIASVAKNLINFNPLGLLMNGISYVISEFDNLDIELGKPFTGEPATVAESGDSQNYPVIPNETVATEFENTVGYVPPSRRGRQEAFVDLSREVEFEFKTGENIYEMLGGDFTRALNIGRPNEIPEPDPTAVTVPTTTTSTVGQVSINETGKEYDPSLNVSVPWQRGGGGNGYDLSNLSLTTEQENLLTYNFAQAGIGIPTAGFLTQAIQGVDTEWSDPTGGRAGLAPAFRDGLDDMADIVREVNATFEEMGGTIDWATGRITKGFTGTATIMSKTLDDFIDAVGATSTSLGIYGELSTWDDLVAAGQNAYDIFKKRKEAEEILVESMLGTAEALATQVANQRDQTLTNIFGSGKIGGTISNEAMREEFDNLGRGGFQADMESRAKALAQQLGEADESGMSLLQKRAKAEEAIAAASSSSERDKYEAILQMINTEIGELERAAAAEMAAIVAQRDAAHNDAVLQMEQDMGMVGIQKAQQAAWESFRDGLIEQGYTLDQVIEQMGLFEQKQLIELDKANRDLDDSYQSLTQATWDQIAAFSSLTNLLGVELPDSLSSLRGLTQVDLIEEETVSNISNAINNAGLSTAQGLGLLQVHGNDADAIKAAALANYNLDIDLSEIEKMINFVDKYQIQGEAQLAALQLNSEADLLRTKGMIAGTDALSELISHEQKLTEIRNSGADNAEELITAERKLLAIRRTEAMQEVERSGYQYESRIQGVIENYTDKKTGSQAVIDILSEIGLENLTPDQRAEYDYQKAMIPKYDAAMAREIALINKEILDDLNKQNVNYSDLGNANQGFITNLETIAAENMLDFSWNSLGIDVSDTDLFEALTLGKTLNEEQNKQIKAAIAARRRELDMIEKKNTEESVRQMSSFFGVEKTSYTYSQFVDALEALEETIKSLDKTMEDIYYSDLNPTPMTEKMESADKKYDQLFAKALTPDEEGNYNAEAISEFQSYVQTYLGMQKDINKSSMAYLQSYNRVMADIESVQDVASLYGTQNATERFIEGLEELSAEMHALGSEEGFAGEVDALIVQMKDNLPDGMEEAYDAMTTSARAMDYDVESITSTMVQTMRDSVSTMQTDFGSLFGTNGSLNTLIESFTQKVYGAPTDTTTLNGAFKSLIDDIKTWLDTVEAPSWATPEVDNGQAGTVSGGSNNSSNVTTTTVSPATDPTGTTPPSPIESNSFMGSTHRMNISGAHDIGGSTYTIADDTFGDYSQFSDYGTTNWSQKYGANQGTQFLAAANTASNKPSGADYESWYSDSTGKYHAIDLDTMTDEGIVALFNRLNQNNFVGNWGNLSSWNQSSTGFTTPSVVQEALDRLTAQTESETEVAQPVWESFSKADVLKQSSDEDSPYQKVKSAMTELDYYGTDLISGSHNDMLHFFDFPSNYSLGQQIVKKYHRGSLKDRGSGHFYWSMVKKGTVPEVVRVGVSHGLANPAREQWGYTGYDFNNPTNIPDDINYWLTNGGTDIRGEEAGLYFGRNKENTSWPYGGGSDWNNSIDNGVKEAWSWSNAIQLLASQYPEKFAVDGDKLSMLKAATGGFLQGASHAQGGIPIEAEGGEYIIRKSSVDNIGVPYLEYLNEEGGLPFMRFGMGEFLKNDQEVGMTEVNSSDDELKSLIRELIHAIKEGDMDIVDALEELEPSVDVNVYTDLTGEMDAKISAYDYKIKEGLKRGLNYRRDR